MSGFLQPRAARRRNLTCRHPGAEFDQSSEVTLVFGVAVGIVAALGCLGRRLSSGRTGSLSVPILSKQRIDKVSEWAIVL